MGKKPYKFYFYKNGERVATMIVYGEAEPISKILDNEKLSPWRLFDKVGNTYFFVWREVKK